MIILNRSSASLSRFRARPIKANDSPRRESAINPAAGGFASRAHRLRPEEKRSCIHRGIRGEGRRRGKRMRYAVTDNVPLRVRLRALFTGRNFAFSENRFTAYHACRLLFANEGAGRGEGGKKREEVVNRRVF